MSRRPAGEPPELAGYDHVRLLGSGGFADVFLYSQNLPKRNVAVKVMTEEAAEGQSREQFTAEANLMAQLSSHGSIVSIYHAGTSPDGRPFLVMQYCPLPNLADRTRRKPLGVAESVGIGVRLAGALETAHRAGIVHRDIKPANVLTTEYGRPALTDFGIAGLLSNTLTETAGLSIPWAPPEAIDGQVTGVAGDVYSLGATIFTILVGRSPFTRPGGPNTRLDYTTRIRRDPLPRIEREDMPESLQKVLDKSMAKQPSQRYQSAADLGRALQMVEQEMRLPMTEIEMPDTSWLAPDPQDRRAAPKAALKDGAGKAGSSAASASGSSGATGASSSDSSASSAESSTGSSSTGSSSAGTSASGTASSAAGGTSSSATSGAVAPSAGSASSGASGLSALPPPTPQMRADGVQGTQNGTQTGAHTGALPVVGSPGSTGWSTQQGSAPAGASSPGVASHAGLQPGSGQQGGGRQSSGDRGGKRRAGSAVVITAVVCVMAIVVSLIWAFGRLTSGASGTSTDPTGVVQADGSTDTTEITVPGMVDTPTNLIGSRSGEDVTFTWDPAEQYDPATVSYVWNRVGTTSVQAVSDPVVSVSDPGEVCIDVKIRLSNGRTSNEPATACVEEEA
ncbi:serine/threonine protein kinase [Actinomycetales bacterium JB111]|nr:serine/threonine protein kinase [Actinomycetales bacterium JB111]